MFATIIHIRLTGSLASRFLVAEFYERIFSVLAIYDKAMGCKDNRLLCCGNNCGNYIANCLITLIFQCLYDLIPTNYLFVVLSNYQIL